VRREARVREPQEIEDRQDERVVARVAAVDVAKASGVVCTRIPRDAESGRFITKVWPVDATTNAILELADHLARLQVDKVVLESTSDYWRPFFYLLEAAGLVSFASVVPGPAPLVTGPGDDRRVSPPGVSRGPLPVVCRVVWSAVQAGNVPDPSLFKEDEYVAK
jgi:hypothetical protein